MDFPPNESLGLPNVNEPNWLYLLIPILCLLVYFIREEYKEGKEREKRHRERMREEWWRDE